MFASIIPQRCAHSQSRGCRQVLTTFICSTVLLLSLVGTASAAPASEPPGPSSRRTALVITEIMYNPRATWAGGDGLEFIEIWNSGIITEDLTGHRIDGEVTYAFPANTQLAPGQFLVVARNPAAAQAFYGVTCLGPIDSRLNNAGGDIYLVNELGGRLLEISYRNRDPWPAAANGSGHSLVLSRPSYGENDPRAWSASATIGGSPGGHDSFTPEVTDALLINEFLAHTDAPQEDFVELFNTSSQPINISGLWLTDSPETNKFRIPNGTVIPARGFRAYTQSQLGFGLSSVGERLFLVNSNETRVIDAVAFDGQENGVPTGRFPNGAPGFQRLANATMGGANAGPMASHVRINEIMYHPISESDDDEYLELHNRAGTNVSLVGWQIQDGIQFTFPPGAMIPANGFVVVAKNAAHLIAKYPQLNANNTFGNYSGSLRNSGERVALTMPDEVDDNGVTTIIHITLDEVAYADGGRWGKWSDGGGSSLELVDPRADGRLASNWADSEESNKAAWTSIDVTEILENGQSFAHEGGAQGTPNRLEMFLQDIGEVLVDNVEFRSNGSTNRISNGNFNSAIGWVFGGVTRGSFVESGVGFGGTPALHLVATGRGDTGPNKVFRGFSPAAATGGNNTGTIRAQVRWLKGSPYILMRLRGNWMEVSRRLNIPENLGTPGQVNSRRVINAAPAIHDVTHFPILPSGNQPVVVTARVTDPDPLGSVTLRYRVDPSATYTSVLMVDNGTGGDAVAGDGLYSATVPGQSIFTLVAFNIAASDNGGAAAVFPAEHPVRECLVRWGEPVQGGAFGSYRLWLTSSNVTFWTGREKNANDPIDATFVYNNQRVIYNVDTMYSGSPFHTPAYDGPLGSMASDYEVNFPPDQRFLGSEPIVLTAYDVFSGNFFFNDDSAQVDLTGTWIARKLGQPYNYRRHVHMFVNGTRRGTIYDDTQQPNSEMLDQYFPDDENGQLRKIESWFEFADNGQTQGSIYATLGRVNKSNGEIDAKRYRWNWRPRVTANHDEWAPFTNLVAAVNNTTAPNYVDLVRTWMDVPNFLRPVITHHVAGSWDSYAYERGKNMFAYKPDNAGWRLMMWDIEISLGAGGNSPNDSIYNMFDTTLLNLIRNYPVFHREYLRGFQEAVDGPLAPGVADVALDERYAAFQQNGIPLQSPQFIKNYISQRRTYLMSILPNISFNLASPAFQILSGSNMVTLTGTAPLSVETIQINGIPYRVNWTSISNWFVTIPLTNGVNVLNVTAADRNGQVVAGATGTSTVNFTGPDVDPAGWVVINEIMHRPVVEGAGYVEVFNSHSNRMFDLSGWNVNGLGYTFPPGSVLPPRGFLVLAADARILNETYGPHAIAFDQYPGTLDLDGETLTLQRPVGTNWVVVSRVRYENRAPWPGMQAGLSLQLIDPRQDHGRVANWAVGHTNFMSLPPASIVLVDYTNHWRYMQVSNLDSANWTATHYNDSSWPAGPGLLAFESGNAALNGLLRTTLNDPRVAMNNVSSGHAYYFRTQFALTNDLTGYVVTARVYADDGMILHVNGGEVAPRIRMNPGPAFNSTLASDTPGNGDITQPEVLSLAATLFDPGTNTLAVQVHQATSGSSDIVFGLRLEAIYTNASSAALMAASPGFPNAVAKSLPPFPPLWLNEVQPVNVNGPMDNFNQRDPWVELLHNAPTNFSLAGYFLSDSYTNLTRWAFPAGATLGANAFSLVWCDNQTNQTGGTHWHAGFQLPASGGQIVLSRMISNKVQIVDYLNYTNLAANWSYGNVPDAQPFFRRNMFYPTPAAPNNGAAAPIAVFINEWLADNEATLVDPADGQFEDWFEIHNPGDTPVDLGGYYFTDNLNNPLQFQVPNNGHYVVPPGGYLLVWADNESNQNATNRADLHVDFALSKGGEAIGLYGVGGVLIDAVVFGSQDTDVSEGRYPDGSGPTYSMPVPTPRMPNVVPNSPPVLETISNRVVTVGYTLAIQPVASDSDLPAQTLSFALVGAPAGAQINSQSGLFTWTPAAAPATNTIQLIVTDSGTPSLSATQTFTVVTAPVPALGGFELAGSEMRFGWNTFAGQQYQLEYKEALSDSEWLSIGNPILGTGAPFAVTNGIDESPEGYFRLRVLE